MDYETVIGLEVHLHLKTQTKAFCGCSTEFGAPPNTHTCPVCLGFPGSLPVFNQQALDFAIKVGLALNCQIQEFTKFDRKNYFYPDLPKNYQISQYDLPLAIKGCLDISIGGKTKRIGITRVHMEEDAGKLIHEQEASLVDFNRAGIPLLEIVSEPDISSPLEAYEYLALLKNILEYLEVSDCDMEKGSLRCDANVSIRPRGEKVLGVKTELKNMNSFKNVRDALEFEINRQIETLGKGEKIIQETRLWDAESGVSVSMRTKEEAKDYRYFPEPDLPPFIINKDKISQINKGIPEMPKEKFSRFVKDYGLSEYDAKILISSKKIADYAEECMKKSPDKNKKSVANWLIGPLAGLAGVSGCEITDLRIQPERLIELIDLVEKSQVISNLTGKAVLAEMASSGNSASVIIKEKNLGQISDAESLEKIAEEVIKENPKSEEAFRQGKENAVMFLVGQVMKKTAGKANPKKVQEVLKRRLSR